MVYCETLVPGDLPSALDCLLREGLIAGTSMLVRAIDSERDQFVLKRILVKYGLPHTLEMPGWIVPGTAVALALDRTLFTGFDEIWLFEGPATLLGTIPQDLVFGNDTGEPLEWEAVPTGLQELIIKNPKLLMLRDGCGLHYMTSAKIYASCLRRMARQIDGRGDGDAASF